MTGLLRFIAFIERNLNFSRFLIYLIHRRTKAVLPVPGIPEIYRDPLTLEFKDPSKKFLICTVSRSLQLISAGTKLSSDTEIALL